MDSINKHKQEEVSAAPPQQSLLKLAEIFVLWGTVQATFFS